MREALLVRILLQASKRGLVISLGLKTFALRYRERSALVFKVINVRRGCWLWLLRYDEPAIEPVFDIRSQIFRDCAIRS